MSFDTLLIANRGEIACRIMRTAKAMGLKTVAVYSDADKDARHVRMADTAVHIGGAAPADSYLRGDRIISAAQDTGAGAIHPGYGFLSENPDFVDAVSQAGLIFVGPSARAIRSMGLKDQAKLLMEKAGVPVVPGYHGADQSDERLSREADAIGYPVMIKAVAGGGGKGMRVVQSASHFAEALASARAEAQSAFGNADVLVEKYIEKPRHIEVQVFGDGTDAIHLFERDCSLQRRHQKVIEEAPAPGMSDEVRAAMGDASVRAARAIGYSGAGTIEFIVDGSRGLRTDGFWFMEMNTRLQVEHPVTECITGLDLVEWQLRIAMGEALPMTQEDVILNGHAFEARLYAEDVPAGFLPAIGRLDHLRFPDGVRADTGVETGDEISPYYDPMIAKVIVHDVTRAAALSKLARGLAQTQVAGTVTNIGFLHALAEQEEFKQGDVDTGLIERHLDALTAAPDHSAQQLAQAAIIAADLWDGGSSLTGFSLWGAGRRTVELEQGDALLSVQSVSEITVEVDGHLVHAHRSGDVWRLNGQVAQPWVRKGRTITLFDETGGRVFSLTDPLDRAGAGGAGGDLVEAPMPGLLREVAVVAGDHVEEGGRIAVLEAMKMEHVLRAPRDGVIARVAVVAGSQVTAGELILQLEPETESEPEE